MHSDNWCIVSSLRGNSPPKSPPSPSNYNTNVPASKIFLQNFTGKPEPVLFLLKTTSFQLLFNFTCRSLFENSNNIKYAKQRRKTHCYTSTTTTPYNSKVFLLLLLFKAAIIHRQSTIEKKTLTIRRHTVKFHSM